MNVLETALPKVYADALANCEPTHAFGAAAVIRNFEETIEKVILLAAFMPIVVSLAGNAGHQTLAVATCSIATGDIHKGDALPLCSGVGERTI